MRFEACFTARSEDRIAFGKPMATEGTPKQKKCKKAQDLGTLINAYVGSLLFRLPTSVFQPLDKRFLLK